MNEISAEVKLPTIIRNGGAGSLHRRCLSGGLNLGRQGSARGLGGGRLSSAHNLHRRLQLDEDRHVQMGGMHAGARRAVPLHLYVHFTLMRIQRCTVYIAIFLSGFAGLGYEMVWARMLALTLGHEIAAVLAVLVSFFSGLALGAWCLDGVVSASPRPALWYALCEGVIGLWALLLTVLFHEANRTMHILTGVASSPLQLGFLCFLLPFLLLLPATFAMGGTLPAIERLFATLRANGRCLGGLYSANTFGAVAGTMLTTFLLASRLGSRAWLIALAAVNFACAAAMWLLRLKTSPPDSPSMKAPVGRMNGKLAAVLFLTGFLGIGFEVMAVRVLSQVFENTIYLPAGHRHASGDCTNLSPGVPPRLRVPGALQPGNTDSRLGREHKGAALCARLDGT
jgi:hypothetical protein